MPTTKRILLTTLPTAVGLLLAAVLLVVLGGAAGRAAAAPFSAGLTRFVTPAGTDTSGCTSVGSPCRTIQWALDRALNGDDIQVAAGVYTSAGGTVARISQTVTLQGGWNSSFTRNDPAGQPTILDGQGLQTVVVISPTALPSGAQISPTVEGLVIMHGQGQNQVCGAFVVAPGDDQCGGGVASLYADPLILNNVISDNIGGNFTYGLGGGLYLYHATSAAAVISGNLVYSNIANIGGTGLGGGIAEHSSLATIQGNSIWRNRDSLAGTSNGAGIKLFFSHASIIGNDIRENVSSNRGGGIHVSDNNGIVVISGNTILSNTAAVAAGGVQITGNGLGALIVSNTIAYNQVLSTIAGRGGGIRVSADNTGVTISHNDLYSNVAAWGGGSAIDLVAPGVVDGNYLHENQNGLWGAALVLSGTAPMTATNNLIVDNLGAGIEAVDFGQSVSVVNNTVVGGRNSNGGAAGTGLLVQFDTAPSTPITATLVNNLIVNGAACGINLPSSSLVVRGHHNDVHGNGTDYCGSASSAGNLNVDPLFVNASAGDYHLRINSPAVNAGSNAEAPATDKDGVSRPRGWFVDIGAYEYPLLGNLLMPLIQR